MDTGTDTQSTPSMPPRQELRREAFRFAKLVVCLLATVLFIRTFIFETWPVQGPSMTPTLNENDRIVVLKLPLLLSRLPFFSALDPLQQGDLVVFETHDPQPQKLIKRVVAAGPATENDVVRAAPVNAPSPYDVRVLFDRGAVYVNNRLLKEAYLNPAERHSPDVDEVVLHPGQLYVLGDHRSVSKDSRLLGPIQRGQIVGEAVFRVWPLSRFGWL